MTREFIQYMSQIQWVILKVQPHKFWRLSVFQEKGCTHRCIQKGKPAWKMEVKGLDIPMQNISINDFSTVSIVSA